MNELLAKSKHGPVQCTTPERAFVRIGELSKTLGVPAYVLRFWETQFPRQIKPVKVRGRRVYSPQDIDAVSKIKFLLYEEGYTIKGAKSLLSNLDKKSRNGLKLREALQDIQDELGFIREVLITQIYGM